jgi:hypothetical protein
LKVTQSDLRTVTLRLSRTEFENLSKVLCMTIYMLVGARQDGILRLSDDERKTGEAFLPKIHSLLRSFTRIAIQKGWLDDEEEGD